MVYLLSVIGGYFILKNNRLGHIFVIISYICQIPVVITSALNYHITSGAKLWITFINLPFYSKLDFKFSLGSEFAFSFYNAFEGYIIGINILAILIVRYLIISFKHSTVTTYRDKKSTRQKAYSSREFIK